ncbi:MAG: hypothetical protein IJO98_04545 [Clostridia bacterium]|nr:hypothetical protein [Clostridia bacterium]
MRIGRRRKRAKVLERKELGIFVLLFIAGIAYVLWAAFPLIQGAPTLEELHRVHGTVKQAYRLERRRLDYYRIVLDVNGQEKVYSLSQFYRPDRTGAIEKFAAGDVIQLYLERTGRSWNVNDWVDGSVYGIYDRYGKPIHPIEVSWREREKDCWVGLWFGGVMEAVCGACIWLLVRHPKWIARMNRWSESVPERRYIEFGRRKRK